MPPVPLIYHMCRVEEWTTAGEAYRGSSQDQADGFIHFSAAEQIVESAAKHRRGQAGLLLLAVDPTALGAELRWESSRGGQLFPHLYGALPRSAVRWAVPLPLGVHGVHVFPDLLTGIPPRDPSPL